MANCTPPSPASKPQPLLAGLAPPTDKAYNVIRAFEAGWGGVVWKTLGEDGPPVVNVNGPRYGALLGPTGACWASTTSS
jgi:dihydropyrimidine dehydrogenase (NAD+) subunit PreA